MLYGVTGPELFGSIKPYGFAVNLTTNEVIDRFESRFDKPHDIAVSDDGNAVYEIELAEPFRVTKFVKK